MGELKWSDEDIKDIRDALLEVNSIDEELNARCIAFYAMLKNSDKKVKLAQGYIAQLEYVVATYTNQNE
jgi:hypothetical protein